MHRRPSTMAVGGNKPERNLLWQTYWLSPLNWTSTLGVTEGKLCTYRRTMEDALPVDIWEAILKLLDRKTLCSARLVSKSFCAAASAHICSLTVQRASQAVSLARFPRLGRVTVHDCGYSFHMHSVLQDVITTLSIPGYPFNSLDALDLALMPKLRVLDLGFDTREWFDEDGWNILDPVKLGPLSQYTTLEILRLAGAECYPFAETAAPTSLTELDMTGMVWPDGLPEVKTWLQHATALKHLKSLRITAPSEVLPVIGNLTNLTRLAWYSCDLAGAAYDLAPLTRLSKLRALSVHDHVSESHVDTACSLASGSLVSLTLEASEGCGRFLTRQTALTQLSLAGELCNSRHIVAVRLESLQVVALDALRAGSAAAETLSALHRASSLTWLRIGLHRARGVQLHSLRLSRALAGLTQLRCLKLTSEGGEPPAKLLLYALAVGSLTGLTRLSINSGELDSRALRALLVLTGLRVLSLSHSHLTDAVVPDLSRLSNLDRLTLTDCGIRSLAPVTDVLNPLRRARGWPRMVADLYDS